MKTSMAESANVDSNAARNKLTDAGIKVDFLVFAGDLVEKAIEAAMTEVPSSNDNQVT